MFRIGFWAIFCYNLNLNITRIDSTKSLLSPVFTSALSGLEGRQQRTLSVTPPHHLKDRAT